MFIHDRPIRIERSTNIRNSMFIHDITGRIERLELYLALPFWTLGSLLFNTDTLLELSRDYSDRLCSVLTNFVTFTHLCSFHSRSRVPFTYHYIHLDRFSTFFFTLSSNLGDVGLAFVDGLFRPRITEVVRTRFLFVNWLQWEDKFSGNFPADWCRWVGERWIADSFQSEFFSTLCISATKSDWFFS